MDNPQTAIMNKLMLYVFPIGVVVGAPFLPLAVLIYWVANNLWTLGQQYVVYRRIDSEEADRKKEQAAVATAAGAAPRGPGRSPCARSTTRPSPRRPTAREDRPAKTAGAKPARATPRPAKAARRRPAKNARRKRPGEAQRHQRAATDNGTAGTSGARGAAGSRPPAARGRKRR